jgi:hypothetical protein
VDDGLQESSMPNPRYMDHQSEIEWSMRTTLIDWLLQVHARYHMLPETLWIAINIVDRFLSNRVVSLLKFQLVGVTAMFVAAKYEEIMAPSVDEFVYMTEGGYSREEILKGERIILQSLEFNISTYCSPYSWVRRISKADDYDIQTRTLSKFLMEVTLLDHRFLRAKPSMIAAIGMYLARRMLGGDWVSFAFPASLPAEPSQLTQHNNAFIFGVQNESFIFYSNFTEAHLLVPAGFLLESIAAPGFEERFVYRKYSTKSESRACLLVPATCTSQADLLPAAAPAFNRVPQGVDLCSQLGAPERCPRERRMKNEPRRRAPRIPFRRLYHLTFLRRLLLPNSLVPQLYSPFSLFISSLLSSLRTFRPFAYPSSISMSSPLYSF